MIYGKLLLQANTGTAVVFLRVFFYCVPFLLDLENCDLCTLCMMLFRMSTLKLIVQYVVFAYYDF